MSLLNATGLRRSEVVTARVDDLQGLEHLPDGENGELVGGWRLIGKGQRLRQMPIDVVGQLAVYLEDRGLDADSEHAITRVEIAQQILGHASLATTTLM